MLNVINTESWLFNLYATRMIRVGDYYTKTKDDVIRKQADNIDICNYFRSILLQILHRSMINLGKFIAGFILGFIILTDVMTFGLWAFTDNGFIPFFGEVGGGLIMIQFVLIAFVAVVTAVEYGEKFVRRFTRSVSSAGDTVASMSTYATVSQWVKAKHGKFCVKLAFDRTPSPKPKDEWDRE